MIYDYHKRFHISYLEASIGPTLMPYLKTQMVPFQVSEEIFHNITFLETWGAWLGMLTKFGKKDQQSQTYTLVLGLLNIINRYCWYYPNCSGTGFQPSEEVLLSNHDTSSPNQKNGLHFQDWETKQWLE